MTAAWPVSTVGEQFDVQLGKRLDAAVNRGELKPCINNRAVRWGHVQVSDSVLAPLTEADIRDLRLMSGDVLVCEGGEIGRASVWNGEIPEVYFLNTLHRLRSHGRYEPRLLVGMLENMAKTGELSALVGKSSLAHLTKENLLRVRMPMPPLVEQKRIVECLLAVDQLVATLERVIVKKQAIKQGVMQQLLTGKTRLPGFCEPLREAQLCNLLKRPPRYGVNAPAVPISVDVNTYIRITDIDDLGRFSPQPRVGVTHPNVADYLLREGELVFARTGASVGKSYLYDARDGVLVYAGFLINIAPDPDVLEPKYLALYAQTSRYWDWVGRTSVRSGQPGINGREYGQLRIELPDIREQHAIVEVFKYMEAEIDILDARLNKAKAIKHGMMQQLLTGRTRLPAEEGAA